LKSWRYFYNDCFAKEWTASIRFGFNIICGPWQRYGVSDSYRKLIYFIIWFFKTVFNLNFIYSPYLAVYYVFLAFSNYFKDINKNSKGLYNSEQKSIQFGVANAFYSIIQS
jgi:hypothetical protein